MSLSDQTPIDAAADIAVGVAAGSWLARAASNDPLKIVREPGRPIPSVIVQNDVEYATMAVGQIGLFHLLWPFIGMPFVVVTMAITVLIPGYLLSQAHMAWVTIPLFFFWCWLFAWRLYLRVIWRHGPRILRGDDYHGVLPRSR